MTSVTRKIYVAGSLRNPEIIYLTKRLEGVFPNDKVFSDWYAAGPEADDHWKAYEQARGRSYGEALTQPAARNVFEFDKKHILDSDVFVLALPAGKSGHLEAGWHAGVAFATLHYEREFAGNYFQQRKLKPMKTIIYLDPNDDPRWDVMYQFVDFIAHTEEALIEAIKA